MAKALGARVAPMSRAALRRCLSVDLRFSNGVWFGCGLGVFMGFGFLKVFWSGVDWGGGKFGFLRRVCGFRFWIWWVENRVVCLKFEDFFYCINRSFNF